MKKALFVFIVLIAAFIVFLIYNYCFNKADMGDLIGKCDKAYVIVNNERIEITDKDDFDCIVGSFSIITKLDSISDELEGKYDKSNYIELVNSRNNEFFVVYPISKYSPIFEIRGKYYIIHKESIEPVYGILEIYGITF